MIINNIKIVETGESGKSVWGKWSNLIRVKIVEYVETNWWLSVCKSDKSLLEPVNAADGMEVIMLEERSMMSHVIDHCENKCVKCI